MTRRVVPAVPLMNAGSVSCCAIMLADREQGLFQADEKQCQANQHVDKADQYALQVRDRLAQHQQLEAENDGNDRQDVQYRRQPVRSRCASSSIR